MPPTAGDGRAHGTRTSAISRPAFSRAGTKVRLAVRDGADRGTSIVLGSEPVAIGTSDDAALSLTDAAVSRQHAEIVWDGTALGVTDRSSKNGTWIGAVRIREALVPLGTEIRVGGTTLVAVPEDEILEPAAAQDTQLGELVGTSRVMRQLFTLVRQIAPTSLPILIEGETGIGKHAVAAELHALSTRTTLTTFDCADPATDLDAAFAESHTGTLLLDDVAALSPEHQTAALRILDRKVVRPTQQRVDVRIIAISRGDITEQLATGAFRDDLFYRLAAVRIAIPPLRDRREDIAVLARHFGGSLDTGYADHDWPGNVRELKNVLAGAQLTTSTSALAPVRTFREAKAEAVDAFERGYLEELMRRHTSLHAASDASGMDRKHLRTLLRRHGLRDN